MKCWGKRTVIMADKYFMATLEYNEPHVDKYLISNVNNEKEATDIAENHNADPEVLVKCGKKIRETSKIKR